MIGSHTLRRGWRIQLSSFRQITPSTLDEVDLSTPASARRVWLNFLAHMITAVEDGFSVEPGSHVAWQLTRKVLTFHRQSLLILPSFPAVLVPTTASVITNREKPCFYALLIGYRLLRLTYAILQIFLSPELGVTTRLNHLLPYRARPF